MKKSDQKAVVAVVAVILVSLLAVVYLPWLVTKWSFARFQKDMAITVPESPEATSGQIGDSEKQIVVMILADGRLEVDGRGMAPTELVPLLKIAAQRDPDQSVHVLANPDANFQEVIRLMDLIKKAGIWSVSFNSGKPGIEK